MEILLDDYKRRLKSVTELIEKAHSNGSIVHQRREERLNTKAAEYRTFIVEIERAKARRSNENSGLNISDVMLSAYFVDIKHTKIVVLAQNIADACDKLDRDGFKDYSFIHSHSFDIVS